MFLHAPFCLEQTIFHRMPDPGESLRIGGIETEIIGFVGGFDGEGVGEGDYRCLSAKPYITSQAARACLPLSDFPCERVS